MRNYASFYLVKEEQNRKWIQYRVMGTHRTAWCGNCNLQICSFPVCCFRYLYGSTQLDIYKKNDLGDMWPTSLSCHLSKKISICLTCQYSSLYVFSGLSCCSRIFFDLPLGIFFPGRILTEILVYLLKWYKISEGNSGPFVYFLIKTSTQYI